jgi:gas vesicle protein
MAEENYESRVVWFFAGAAIGATVALLFAPQSGRKTRQMIGRRANDGRDALSEAGHDIAEKSKELYDKGKRIADEAADLFDRGRKLVQG